MEPESLQTFYADIRAARIARIPVELTSRSLLQSIETPTQSQLTTLADTDNPRDASIGTRHQAAIDIHNQLGSMVPVLDGLSARAIASRKFSLMFRRVLWYLALVLLVALVGLLYFKFNVQPEYELIREDMRVHYGMKEFNTDMFPYLDPMIVVVAVLLFLNLFFLITNKTGLLLNLFGGRKYVRLKVSSAAAKTLALLASQDTALPEATQTTAALYALDATGRQQLSSSIGDTPSFDTWQNLSQFWSIKAMKTLERARTLAPVVLFSIVGGGVAVGYGLIVYGPLIGLIRDLVEAGVRS